MITSTARYLSTVNSRGRPRKTPQPKSPSTYHSTIRKLFDRKKITAQEYNAAVFFQDLAFQSNMHPMNVRIGNLEKMSDHYQPNQVYQNSKTTDAVNTLNHIKTILELVDKRYYNMLQDVIVRQKHKDTLFTIRNPMMTELKVLRSALQHVHKFSTNK